MRLARVRESDDLGYLEALRTHYLTSGLPKIPLRRGRESDDSRGRRVTEISGRSKMCFGRSRESDVSSGHQEVRIHFLSLDQPKMRLV